MYIKHYQYIVGQLVDISCELHDKNWHIYLFYSQTRASIEEANTPEA